jgi:hypothetical protein
MVYQNIQKVSASLAGNTRGNLKVWFPFQNNSPKNGNSLVICVGIKEKIAYIVLVYLFNLEVLDKLKINCAT